MRKVDKWWTSFEQFEGGAASLATDSALEKVLEKEYGSPDIFQAAMKGIGNMRGPGWAILYYDKKGDQILSGFAGEQHQGHFVTLPIILAATQHKNETIRMAALTALSRLVGPEIEQSMFIALDDVATNVRRFAAGHLMSGIDKYNLKPEDGISKETIEKTVRENISGLGAKITKKKLT